MVENIKWFICGSIIGMGAAAVVVATNKNIQKKIAKGIDDATKKAKEIKEITLKKSEEGGKDTKENSNITTNKK